MTRVWYKRYPSNFISGTIRLTLEEKGAYSMILDCIYDNEGPIEDVPQRIAHLCGCSTRKWKVIREKLIQEGKISVSDGFISNERAEKEILKNRNEGEKLAENGAKGAKKTNENKKKPLENSELDKKGPEKSERHTRSQKEERTNVLYSPSSPPGDGESQNPTIPEAISEEHPTHDPPGELTDPTACKPLDEASQAVNAWNEMAAECDLAQVQKLTTDRRKKLNKRLKDCDGIEGWMYALEKIRSTPGLQGKAGKSWKANFDFLIQESKFVKLMEGGYDGWTANGYNTANDFNAAPRQESNRDVFMSALHEVACGR